MTFRAMSYEEFQKTWSEPIDTVRRAIIALTEDIAMFQAMGLHKRHNTASEEFLRSLVYYSEVLVLDSLVKIKGRRQFYAPTSALPRNETIQTIDSKLTDAQLAFNRFVAVKEDVLATAGWNFVWKAPKAGDKVPTASPYQLLYQMICLDKMASAPTDRITRVLLCKFYHSSQHHCSCCYCCCYCCYWIHLTRLHAPTCSLLTLFSISRYAKNFVAAWSTAGYKEGHF